MFESVSDELKLKALLTFTRVLIKNSKNAEIFKLNEILIENQRPVKETNILSKEEIKKKIKEEIKERIKEEVKTRFEKPKENKIERETLRENFFEPKKTFSFPVRKIKKPVNFSVRRVLRVPKVSLPPYLRSIKPVPSNKVSIDLGKLNPFVRDPNVLSIETYGENEVVYVNGAMGRKPTNLRLSKTEIEEVINRFSEASKIPKSEGLFKVAVGKLLLTATISESVSPRFIIEKIKAPRPSSSV